MSPPASDRVPSSAGMAHLGVLDHIGPAFVAKGWHVLRVSGRRRRSACWSRPSSPTSTCRSSTSRRSMRWAMRPPRRIAVPIALIVAYGGMARVLAQALGELRDAIFAPVSQRAIRNLARSVRPSPCACRCASISSARPAAEPGHRARHHRHGILIRFTTFNILPTLFEIGLVGVIPWSLYDWRFSAVTLGVVGYIVFSVAAVGMAHQVRAPHERRRHRGQRQGDRQPAELRDGEVFRQRGARGAPLRRRPAALRDRGDPVEAAPCRCSTSARAPSSRWRSR